MKKDFISILDITREELEGILAEAEKLKRQKKAGVPHALLDGKTLAMIFEKSSTRTHISFEVGMNELGGHALFDPSPGRSRLERLYLRCELQLLRALRDQQLARTTDPQRNLRLREAVLAHSTVHSPPSDCSQRTC